jgi:hypothetical protein
MEKLDPQINQPVLLELLYDKPLIGSNTYGNYFCYKVKTDKGSEVSFFATEEIHNQLKNKTKGVKFELTKQVSQRGKKLVTDFEIKFLNNGIKEEKKTEPKSEDNGYFEAMLKSYEDASRIQQKYSAVNLNQCAVSIFIARVNKNGFNNNYPKE